MKTLLALLTLALVPPAVFADATVDSPHKGWDLREVRAIPIQNGGRIKPLDTFARDTILYVTGSRTYAGWDSMDLLLSWLAAPTSWQTQPFVQVTRLDVRKQLGLDPTRTRFSPEELLGNYTLLQYAERMGRGEKGAESPIARLDRADPRDAELRGLLDRLGLYRAVVSGEAWSVIPSAGGTGAEGGAAWHSLLGKDKEGETIRTHFVHLVRSYQEGDQAGFVKAATLARSAAEARIPSWTAGDRRLIRSEVFYHWLHPFRVSWVLYLLAALAWSWSLLRPKAKHWLWIGHGASGLGFALHVSGMGLRSYIAGRPPVTNMYESVVWVFFGVMFFAYILYALQRKRVLLAAACALSAIGLMVGDSAPAVLDPSLKPLVPVLRSNLWLLIHVLTITLGYSAFALTLGISNVALFQVIRGRTDLNKRLTELNFLTYRAMQFGVVLLGAGTILGGVWADYSWGRFWGWDPKEVWALIALLCYVAILHGRYTAWMGEFGYAAWSVMAFLSVVMAWYGVNFVLGVGLHSYGFSTGGRGSVFGYAVAQLAFVGWAMLVHRKKLKPLKL